MKRSQDQKMAEETRARKIIAKHDHMMNQLETLRSTLKEVLEYVHPNRNTIYEVTTPGEKRGQYLFDSTATRSANELSNSLHSLMTNPSVPFFALTTGDEEIDSRPEVAEWLQDCSNRMHAVLNASNFNTEIAEFYLDLVTVGTAIILQEADNQEVIRFYSIPVWFCAIQENAKGKIDCISRQYKYSLTQIVEEWGMQVLSDEMARLYKAGDKSCGEKKYNIIHHICPRENNNGAKYGTKAMSYESCKVWKEELRVLSEKGYHEFPAAVTRWTKTSDEITGRSPAMDLLPDIKSINAMKKAELMGMQLTVSPPLQAKDNSLVRPISWKPLSVTYVRGDAEIKPIVANARVDLGLDVIEYYKQEIKSGFLLDKLQIAERDRMTATEIMQRRDEQFRTLGGVLGRLQEECLKPIVNREFKIMLRAGLFKPIPQGITKTLDVKYNSMIAKSQKAGEYENFMRVIQSLGPLIEVKPDLWDNIDADYMLRTGMRNFNADLKSLYDETKVKNIRKARADMQQQQIDLQSAEVMGKSAKGLKEMGQ